MDILDVYLPVEIVHHILSYINIPHYLRVCKLFYDVGSYILDDSIKSRCNLSNPNRFSDEIYLLYNLGNSHNSRLLQSYISHMVYYNIDIDTIEKFIRKYSMSRESVCMCLTNIDVTLNKDILRWVLKNHYINKYLLLGRAIGRRDIEAMKYIMLAYNLDMTNIERSLIDDHTYAILESWYNTLNRERRRSSRCTIV